MNFFTLIGNSFLQYLGGDQKKFLFLVVFFAILLWLYKEIRKITFTDREKLIERFEKILDIYGSLESRLSLYYELQNEDTKSKLYEEIGRSYPYISQEVLNALREYKQIGEIEKIRQCIELIERETNRLKGNNIFPDINTDEMTPKIYYFFSLAGRLLLPLIITLGVAFVFVSFLAAIYEIQSGVVWRIKVINLIDIIDFDSILLTLAMIFAVTIDGKLLKNGIWKWLLFFIVCLLFSLEFNFWYFKVIPIVVLIIVVIITITLDILSVEFMGLFAGLGKLIEK